MNLYGCVYSCLKRKIERFKDEPLRLFSLNGHVLKMNACD